jgi:hypothetical protein
VRSLRDLLYSWRSASIGFSREAFKAGRNRKRRRPLFCSGGITFRIEKLESEDSDGGAGRASPQGIDRKRAAKFLHGYLVSVLLQSFVSLTEVGFRGAEPSWLVGRRRRGLTQDVLRESKIRSDEAITKIADLQGSWISASFLGR